MHQFGNFRVGFSYPQPNVTKCVIKDLATDQLISEGQVTKHFKDQNIKRVGRLKALTKALDNGFLTREMRKEIFEGYNAIGALKGKEKPKEEKAKDE